MMKNCDSTYTQKPFLETALHIIATKSLERQSVPRIVVKLLLAPSLSELRESKMAGQKKGKAISQLWVAGSGHTESAVFGSDSE